MQEEAEDGLMAKFGRRELTDDEVKTMLPGYEPRHEGVGYYFDAIDGHRRMVTGATPLDQIFVKEGLGYINASSAWEFLDSIGAPVQTVAIDDGIKQSIALVEINPEHVRKVSSAAMRQPILMGIGVDGVHVLDGHHRLAKHIGQNRRNFPALILPPEGVNAFQVRTWMELNGEFVLEYGMDLETADRNLKRTKAKWNSSNIIRKVAPL